MSGTLHDGPFSGLILRPGQYAAIHAGMEQTEKS